MKFVCLLLCVLSLLGCHSVPKIDSVRFVLDDMRGIKDGNVCAVAFGPTSRFTEYPQKIYVGNLDCQELERVYGEPLGSFCLVDNATECFARLEKACRETDIEMKDAMVATFYMDNASPRASYIPGEIGWKIVSSWTRRDVSLMKSNEHCDGFGRVLERNSREIDFTCLEEFLRTERYSMEVVFINEDFGMVDAYVPCGAYCARSFFRCIIHCFPRAETTIDSFVGHLRGHCTGSQKTGEPIKVVVW